MTLLPHLVVLAAWLIWLIVWIVSATNVKADIRRDSAGSRLATLLTLMLVGALLAHHRHPRLYPAIAVPPNGHAMVWLGAILTVAGVAFTIWARLHIGRNWSGAVSVKQDHELVRTGPYAIVRHPIYSGGLLAIAGTAMTHHTWAGLLAFMIAAILFSWKSRVEERFMTETFGEGYLRYRSEVAGLIPFLW